MNVITIGPLYPWRGGIAQYHTALTSAYKSAGHTVYAVTYSFMYPKWLYRFSQLEPHSATTEVVPDVKVHALKFWQWKSALPAAVLQCADMCTFHIWHPYWYAFTWYQLRMLHTHNIRTVAIVHNVFPHNASRFMQWVIRRIWRYVHRHCDMYITHSIKQQELLYTIHPEVPVQYMPHPLYKASQISAVPTGHTSTLQVIFSGFIRPYKGLFVLLDALSTTMSHIHVTIAGESWIDTKAIYDYCQVLGIQEKVTLDLRYVPHATLQSYFQNADIAVFPYIETCQSGMIQYALGHGVPVLVSKIHGLYESLPAEASVLVAPNNPTALAEELDRLAHDLESVQRMKSFLRTTTAFTAWSDVVHTSVQSV